MARSSRPGKKSQRGWKEKGVPGPRSPRAFTGKKDEGPVNAKRGGDRCLISGSTSKLFQNKPRGGAYTKPAKTG